MLEIPIEATPNQSFLCTLGEQDCSIALYQRGRSLYLDMSVGNVVLRQGAMCVPQSGILSAIRGVFQGDLYIADMYSQPEKQQLPQWEGLGTQWRLYYLTPAELDELQTEVQDTGAVNG